MKRLLRAALFAAAPLVPIGAQATCAPLVEALEKAQREPRGAIYEVDQRDQAPIGRPSTIRIGNVVYEANDGTYERHDTGGRDPILAAIRDAQGKGRWTCQAVGQDRYRGKAAEKFRFDNPLLPAQYNPVTLWVDRASGLPAYHEVRGLGGYAWVFGDAIKAPAAGGR